MTEALLKKFYVLNGISDQLRKSLKYLYIFKDYWDEKKSNIFIVTDIDEVYSFGSNERGVLGLDPIGNIVEPTLVPELCSKSIKDFRNGYQHVLALTSDGKVYCWGFNQFGELGVGEGEGEGEIVKPSLLSSLVGKNIVAISCGSGHCAVLDSNGEVYSWGHNSRGQVGVKSNRLIEKEPKKVDGFNDDKVVTISCGDKHSIALTKKGRVFSWGDNDFGQLGVDNIKKSNYPIEVHFSDIDKFPIKKIIAGSYHNLALSNSGCIHVFGNKKHGQLERNENQNGYLPKKLNQMKNFIDIAAHPHYNISIALSENGIYHIWGEIEGKVIDEPQKSKVNSFQDAFATYLQITYSKIKFPMNEIVPNGKYSTNFEEFSILGEGSYGRVSKVKFRPDEKFYAVKKIPVKSEDITSQMKEFTNSIGFIELRSEFIVNYYDVWYENDPDEDGKYESGKSTIFIQMDLCEKTLEALRKTIHEDTNFKNDKLTKLGYFIFCELFIEILEGVEYLHCQSIIHRDLNLVNILIHNSEYGRYVKIADFGLSKFLRKGEPNTLDCGTPKFQAPEVNESNNYTLKADIYSLGVILQILFSIDLKE